MKKVSKIFALIPMLLGFCFFCLSFSLTKTSVSAKDDDFDLFSKSFQTMMQNSNTDYEDPIYINLDSDLSILNKTYMIDVATFADITDIDIAKNDDEIEISNDFATLKLSTTNSTMNIGQKTKILSQGAIYDSEITYIPLKEVATELGYNVDINKNKATLTKPYQTKRVVVETENSVNNLGASFVAEGYHGLHIFQYDTEEQTKLAFETLKSTYTNALVYLDSVVSLDDTKIDGKSDSFSYTNTWGVEATGVNEYSTYLLDDVDESNLPQIVVAVVDTGIDTDHPWFTNRIQSGGRSYFSINPTTSYEDDNGHGTHVAGTIVDMTLSNVKILPIKVLDSKGYGSSVNIRYALEYIITQKNAGVNIVAINMSFGSTSTVGDDDQKAYQTVLSNAYTKGVLCIAAAGNDSKDASGQSPANVSISITVSALKKSGQKYVFDSSYSNYGNYVDFSAPGTSIVSAKMGGGTTTLSGTSMATPHISALVALLYSDPHSEHTPSSIETILKEYSTDLGDFGWDKYYGYGLPNIAYAYSTSIKDVVFSQTETEVSESFLLTLSHQNADATIYYTLDGTIPSQSNGTIFSEPIFIEKTTMVRAIAIVFEGTDVVASSLVKSITYYVDNQDFELNFVISEGEITAYNGSLSVLKIPSQIGGEIVTKIGKSAFAEKNCTKIYLPETVTEVDANAFESMTSLTEIFAPGLTKTGNYSFASCYSLQYVDDEHFPNLETVGKLCFYDCYNLKSVTLSKALVVDYWAFSMSGYQNSTILKSVNLPEVLTLNGGAFYYCTSLTDINLPKCQIVASNAFYSTGLVNVSFPEVVLIGYQAFYGSSNLQSIDFPEALTIGDSCFDGLTYLSSVNLPKCQMVGAFAFNGCILIETLNLPKLTKVGAFAFAECSALSEFDFSNLKEIGISAFSGTTFESIDLLTVTKVSKNAFSGNSNLKSIKLSPNLEIFDSPIDKTLYSSIVLYLYEDTIAEDFAEENNISYVILDCISNLSFYVQNKKVYLTGFVDDGTEIIIPSTILGKPVETICPNAFAGAKTIKKVISNNLKTIESGAFANCCNLEIFECPNLATIESSAFFGCKKLENLTISNVTSVGNGAFVGCDSLEYAMLSKDISFLGEKAFGFDIQENVYEDFVLYGYEGTVAEDFAEENGITFRAKFSELKRYYYNYVDNTKTNIFISFVDESVNGRLVLPSSYEEHTVTAIGSQAFSYCSLITEIILPETITTIDSSAFIGCSMLRSINLENITSLGRYAFQDCTSLKTANLTNLSSVPAYAFYGCYSLESVDAKNATTVGFRAFANCISLASVKLTSATLLGTVSGTKLNGNVFENCFSLEYVALPKATQLGTSLFEGAGTKFVVLTASTISIVYISSISSNITIYGYAGTSAQNLAAQISCPFVEIDEFEITQDLESSKTVSQFDDLTLSVQTTGFMQTYRWFTANGNELDETSNQLQIRTDTVGTQGFVVEITNFDGQKLVSNICCVTVEENLEKVLINYKLHGLGTSSLESNNIFEIGTSPNITFAPNLGYYISQLWIDEVLLDETATRNAEQNGFTFENLFETHFVEVYFDALIFTITATTSNGSISNLLESYAYGTSTTLYITPDVGYQVLQVFVDGQLYADISKIVFQNLTANHEIVVLFKPRTDTPYTILHLTQSFDETDYLFGGVYYDLFEDETQLGTTNQTTLAVAKSIQGFSAKNFSQQTILGDGSTIVNILYTRQSFDLTLSKNSGFSSVSGAGNYLFGESVTIFAELKNGCTFSCWQSCDILVVENGTTLTYTFTMPSQNFSFRAIAIVPTYFISVDSVLYGTETTQSGYANMEEDFVVTIVPNIGFVINTIVVDGQSLDATTLELVKTTLSYTFLNVTQEHSIQITYAAIVFAVTFGENIHGSFSPASFQTTILGTQTVVITPNLGYEIISISQNEQLLEGLDFDAILQNGFVVKNICENTNFEVVFALKTFTIISFENDSSLGIVTETQTINFGQDAEFEISAFLGNHIEDVLIDGQSVGVIETYTFENVTQNHTIQAIFAKTVYEISVSISGSGTFEGETKAFYGEEISLRFLPSVGFEVFNILVNEQIVETSNTLVLSNISQNYNVDITFSKILLQVFAECSEHGSISFGVVNIASTPKTVQYGDSVSLRITPDECYGIDYILKNGEEYLPVTNSLSFIVTENTEIFVQFSNEFQITSSSDGNGEITNGALVGYGESKTFIIRANSGFMIDDVLVDGQSIGATETYTFDSVDTRHTISAIFTVQTHKITTQVQGSGAICVDNTDDAVDGEERTFTFVAQDGWHLTKVYVNGAETEIEDDTLVLTIDGATTVKAVFEQSGNLSTVIILSSLIGGIGLVTLILAIFIAFKRRH